jgi:hypothetical protein
MTHVSLTSKLPTLDESDDDDDASDYEDDDEYDGGDEDEDGLRARHPRLRRVSSPSGETTKSPPANRPGSGTRRVLRRPA